MSNDEPFISSILSEAQEKYNQNKFKETLEILSLLLTKNYKIYHLEQKPIIIYLNIINH